MSITDDALETYTHLPVHIDPATKQVSVTSSDRAVQDAVTLVNELHTQFKSLETANNVPPPPVPVNPKRTAQINKLRESAGQAMVKKNYAEAARLLTFAVDMALARPDWEPVGLKREELAACYLARAAAHAESREWVDAHRDALCSTECKKGPSVTPQGQRVLGNPKSFMIAGKALLEMGRIDEAVAWLEKGVETEGTQTEDCKNLVKLLEEAKQRQEEET